MRPRWAVRARSCTCTAELFAIAGEFATFAFKAAEGSSSTRTVRACWAVIANSSGGQILIIFTCITVRALDAISGSKLTNITVETFSRRSRVCVCFS